MVRTENDLRAVLRALEPAVPDQEAVFRGVRRRVARRRLVQAGSGLAGVAATVTAIVLVTGAAGPGLPGPGDQPSPSPAPAQQIQTAAYIVTHAATAEKNAARMIQVTRDGAGAEYMSVATQQTLFISSLRIHGRPLLASADGIKGTTYTSTLIDYKDRAYNVVKASTRDGGPWGAKGLTIGSWLPGVTASDPATAYTKALRHGIIKVIGYRSLEGRKAILIQVNDTKIKLQTLCRQAGSSAKCRMYSSRPGSCKALPDGKDEVWLDASTYLEIAEAKITPKSTGGQAGAKHPTCAKFAGWLTAMTRFQWLRPTKHNLALLNLTPPAGFTRVSSHQMGVYLGPYS
jgi:hypothetical protein